MVLVFLSGFVLLRDSCPETTEFFESVIELALYLPALFRLHLLDFGGSIPQSPVGPPGEGRDHLQIAQQSLDRGTRLLGFGLPLHLQKQLRLFHNPLPDLGRCLSPGGIQLPGLPAGELVAGQGGGQRSTLLQTGARYRHQILHRHLRRDLAGTHLLLHTFRKQLNQSQPARYPAHTAIELPS